MANEHNLKPWKKGQSGNPGGRPRGIAAEAREHGPKALEVLVDALDDESPKIRIQAAKELLDRGFGKCIPMVPETTNSLEDRSEEELTEMLEVIRLCKAMVESHPELASDFQ